MTPQIGSTSRRRGGPIRVGHVALGAIHTQAPLLRRVAADPRIDFEALLISDAGVAPAEFGYAQNVAWDADLLGGYRSRFLARATRNRSFDSPLDLRDWDIVPELLRERYEVVWINGWSYLTFILAGLAARAAGSRVVLGETSTVLRGEEGLFGRAKTALIQGVFGRRSLGLYISEENRRWFERRGFGRDRLFFRPYAVENSELRAAAAQLEGSRAELRARFGIAEDAGPVVLYVGRMAAMKKLFVLLEAFRRVRERHRCTLLMVGAGPLEEELRATAARDGIRDVVWTGFLNRSRIPEAYAVADVFVLPSMWRETFGLVVAEAMNFALPILSSDQVGCSTDLVRDGVNGYRVPVDDVGALAGRITELVADPAKAREFGAASREVIEGWTHDRAAEGVLAAIAASVGPERWAASASLLARAQRPTGVPSAGSG